MTPRETSTRGSLYGRALARTLGAKAVCLPISALAVLVSTRTVVDSLGVTGYALFALTATLPSLFPNDLGTLASIVDATARSHNQDFNPLRHAVVSSARVLTWAGILSAATGIVPALLGVWSSLLGRDPQPGTDAAVAVTFVLFGCNLPLSLGHSALIALNRTHLAVLLQAMGSMLTLGLLLMAATVRAPLAAFVAAGFLTQCAVGAACLLLAGRIVGVPLFSLVIGSLRTKSSGPRIFELAGPTAIINVCFAFAYSTDRLVLSHMSDATEVATYSAAAHMFSPAAALISAAGLPLWTIFAHQRGTSQKSSARDVARLTGFFAAGGLLIGLGLVLVGPTVGSWMMHDQADVGIGLMTAFAALLTAQAACQPVGLWLTDASGLRFQAKRVAVMAVVNVALSIPLARLFGAPGPVIGSVVALTVVVLVPNFRRSVSHA